MFPAATLFLDVCVQADLWQGGLWPLIDAEQAANVVRIFDLARVWGVRQGGIVCRHPPTGVAAAAGVPAHCGPPEAPCGRRPPGCEPVQPVRIEGPAIELGCPRLVDREAAVYVDSGCAQRPDSAPGHALAFEYLVAGVRDAVIFGAGIEYGMAHAIDALLARRIRTHVVLDAAGAVDEVVAQTIVAAWKRRGVDGTTTAMLDRMLGRR